MNKRTIFAFLIAPISFGLFLFLIWNQSGTMGILALGMSAVIGYPLALFLGVPLYFLLQKLGANGLVSYGIMALIFALILVFGLVVSPVYSEHDGDLSTLLLRERINQMAFLTFGSFFTVLIFWLIARPDKVAKDS